MKTECAHCKRKFLGWRTYAEHLLEKHPDDEIRCTWARYVLSPESEVAIPSPKPRRRLFARRKKLVPPDEVKTLRKMPKYIKKQYRDAGVPIDKRGREATDG